MSTVAPKAPSRWMRRLVGAATTFTAAYAFDRLLWDDTLQRTAKSFYTLSRIGLDYKMNFEEGKDIMALHQRSSDRLFDLLMANKGLYIKLGQNIANQSAVLPKAFQDKFSELYDSAGTDSWEHVDKILKEELGADYAKHFKSFDKVPIGSASIAQVHKAVLTTGEDVAVKVQHYYIKNQINMDLWTYRVFTDIFSSAFGVPFGFMSSYISDRLKEEVDFTIELNNAKRAKDLIQHDGYLKDKVHVPETFDSLCSGRVLVAEWCDGEPLFKYEELKKGYNTTAIMHDYLKLFSMMIFQWGFIHSDPHPGNLLVRHKNGKQQLVLLDHGLYVELPETLRYEYCTLWKSLFELNDKELKRICVNWGMGSEQSDMFGSMAQLKPYNKTQDKLAEMTRYEREKFMSENFKNFFQNTEKFPLPLIFLGRTMRMVQTLNQRYKSPINRIKMFTREAVNGYYLNAPVTSLSVWARAERVLRYSIYMLTMTIFDLGFIMTKFSQSILGTKSVEDLMQERFVAEMKEMGMEPPEVDILGG